MSDESTPEIRITTTEVRHNNEIIGFNFYCTVHMSDDISFATGINGLIKFIEKTEKLAPGMLERECKFWFDGNPVESYKAMEYLFNVKMYNNPEDEEE